MIINRYLDYALLASLDMTDFLVSLMTRTQYDNTVRIADSQNRKRDDTGVFRYHPCFQTRTRRGLVSAVPCLIR